VPFLGTGPDGAEGALGVLKRGGVTVARGEAILEDKGGDAVAVEPLGDVLALVADGEEAIAAARTDDDGGARGLVSGRAIEGKRRLVSGFVAASARRLLGPERRFLRGRSIGSGQR